MAVLANYCGRFAPSPTGPLHFGSLVAALGSYLDAKYHQGKWLVRLEDLDTPRIMKGAADDILHTLEAFGLYWDDAVLYQSHRLLAYEDELHKIQSIGAAYPCACTRKEIADSALQGIEGQIYPGTCRNHVPKGREGRAWRVRTDFPFRDCLSNVNAVAESGVSANSPPSGNSKSLAGASVPVDILRNPTIIHFNDMLQGSLTQYLENEIGDFVVKRADGLFAYQLAVVVDDAFQGVTHVVRGSDLLSSTPRQIYLQQLLGFNSPVYMHLPVAVNNQNEKLSKQTLAKPIDRQNISLTLLRALNFLRQQIPADVASCKAEELLKWAVTNWNKEKLKGIAKLPVTA
jgi:glutamyl-Q tRNA(Asp) synthetase